MTTEGNVVHYGYIEKFIESLGEKYNIREMHMTVGALFKWCRTLRVWDLR
jgi:hypothetical protein